MIKWGTVAADTVKFIGKLVKGEGVEMLFGDNFVAEHLGAFAESVVNKVTFWSSTNVDGTAKQSAEEI